MAVIVAAAHPQTDPGPRLAEAFALERDGQTKQSIAPVQALLDFGSLNAPDVPPLAVPVSMLVLG